MRLGGSRSQESGIGERSVMRALLLNIAIFAGLALLGLAVWGGQQRRPDPYLQDIQARGVLRVGIDPTYPPFDTVTGGKVGGYDAQLAQEIAGDIGVRVEFQTLALDTLYDALAAGKVDILISALPFVYERQKEVRYSAPYYQAGQVLLVVAGNRAVSSVQDLSGRTAGVELGSNADTEARRIVRDGMKSMQVRSVYRAPEEALSALLEGQVDAAITDNTSAQSYLRAHPGTLRVISPPLTDEPFVVAMPNRASGLLARVDTTIERLRASGKLAEITGLAAR